MKYLAALLALLPLPALAQCLGAAALTWTAPTQNTDGSAYANPDGWRVYSGLAQGNYPTSARVLGSQTNYQVTGLCDGQWFFVVTAVNASGVESAFSSPASKTIMGAGAGPLPGKAGLVVTTQPDPLPALFQSADVGSPALVGSYAVSNGIHTVRGAGADIWFAADQFRFAYTTLVGDGEITARVASLDNTDAWAKAGVMIRETTQPGSRYAFMLVSSMRGVDMQWRSVANANAQQQLSDQTTRTPRWLRLNRTGNVFRGYHSADGVTWTLYSMQTIALSANTLVGLAVTSHNVSASSAGVFDSVVVR